jgi:outer membrane protein assembly factor BamB
LHAPAAEAASVEQILDETGIQGGLVVHVGCGTGKLTAALGAGEAFLVHGLDTDGELVAQARSHVQSLDLYGKVTVDSYDGTHLPYIDNLVNVVIVERLGDVSMDEVLRVLAPKGVAYIRQAGGEWTVTVKPRPDAIDEWTHYLHGPDNNAVAHDAIVSSPFHVQWIAGPKWARHHNHLSSTSAMVSSGGRLFAIVDEGPIASLAQRPQWALVARDAFSGVVLWKKPIGPWEGILRPFRSGPTELARRLVAVDDRVYVTLGYHKPVVALDAATGEVVRRYAETDGAIEILIDGGVLYAVVGTIDPQRYAESRRQGSASPAPRNKRLITLEAETGTVVWMKADADVQQLLPSTLCVGGGRALFQNPTHVVCLDANSGQPQWQAERPVARRRLSWSAPTLVLYNDVVLSADCAVPTGSGNRKEDTSEITWNVTAKPRNTPESVGDLIAFNAENGAELWRCPTAQGYNAPADVFVADELVWASYAPGRNTPDFSEGRDLSTGKVIRRLETDLAFTTTHHHRCYRNKATDRFILLGRTGTELIDLSGTTPVRHCWVRGACQYGVMPANGLIYAPPHACACYIQSKLSGFWALAPRRRREEAEVQRAKGKRQSESSRAQGLLETGPAYGQVSNLKSEIGNRKSDEWLTYRHDAARTGKSTSAVPAELQRAWLIELGGRLTGLVVGEGKLLVAAIDTHTIHAIDADTGKPAWRYTVGGRVDSPPTIHRGLAIVGCADGYVYCLRMSDGALVWRFRAAPVDQRTVAFGQVESVWPVTGSVLVHDNMVYCTAGRSSFLDGGMYLFRLDPQSGRVVSETRFYSRDPQTGQQPEEIVEDVELPGALPDVLACDGQHVFLRDKVLDLNGAEQDGYLPHLYSSAGLLDDTWWHRTYWLWGERAWGRASGWAVMPRYRPSGRILVTDVSTVFGYGRTSVGRSRSLQGYHLFRADKKVVPIDKKITNNNLALAKYQKPAKVNHHWSREVPMVVRGMALAENALFAAGPLMTSSNGDLREPALDAGCPAAVMAFRIDDGQDLARCEIEAQPVFDGMALAYGRVYLATVMGDVVCLKGK